MSIPTQAVYQVDDEAIDLASIAERLGVTVGCAYGRLKRVQARSNVLTWSALGLGAPPSRQRRIVTFVLGLDRDATLDDIVDGIITEDSERDRTKLAALVSAHLHQLTTARKLMRLGTRGHFTYRGTSRSLVDGRGLNRKKAAPKPPMPPKAAKPKREKPAPKPKAERKPAAPKLAREVRAVPVAQPARRVEIRVTDKAPYVVPNAALTPPRGSEPTSTSIAADIAAFEARGGRIQRLKPGESSYSIRAQQEAFLAARGRGRVTQAQANSRVVSNRSADNDDTLDADDLVDVA